MRFLIIIILFFSFINFSNANELDIIKATVKLNTPGICTGIVYKEDDEYIYILSAGHCASHTKVVNVQLYTNPEPSDWVESDVLFATYITHTTEDISVIRSKKSNFGKYPIPKPISLAKNFSTIRKNDEIFSCGCSDGNWPTLFRGFIETVTDVEINIHPSVINGRSGSGLFNKNGEIIGIVVMTNGECVSLDYINRLIPDFLDMNEIELPPYSLNINEIELPPRPNF